MATGFCHPFSMIVCGPSQCGKTHFVSKLLKAAPAYFFPPPCHVIWAYGKMDRKQQSFLEETSSVPITFHKGVPSADMFDEMDDDSEPQLLVLDDLMHEVGDNKLVVKLFTQGCHHGNLSVILLLQNMYHQAPNMVTVRRNGHYRVLFANPGDMSGVHTLERQCFPGSGHFLLDAYKQACSVPYGYLILDFHPRTLNEDLRVCTGIFPPSVVRIFKKKKQ